MVVWEVMLLLVSVLLGVLVIAAAGRIAREGRYRGKAGQDIYEMIGDLQAEMKELKSGLEQQREQLGDTLERLDFTERMLIRVRESGALPPGENP